MFKNLMVVIVIDLEKPETIVESFVEWICYINTSLMTKFSDLEPKIREEAQAHFERSIIRNKMIFSTLTDNELADPALLMENLDMDAFLGLPLMIIANKSDAVQSLSLQGYNYVQYTLRTLAVKYGASLIFTSSKQNGNLKNLYAYLSYIMLNNENVKLEADLKPEKFFVPMSFDQQEDLEKEFSDSKNFSLKKKGFGSVDKSRQGDETEEIIEPLEFLKGFKEGKILYFNAEKDILGGDMSRKITMQITKKSIFEQPKTKILEVIEKKKF